MTTKLTDLGIQFEDGSLQTTASTTGVPTANWTKLGTGLILQWGTFTITGDLNQVSVTFPLVFDTAILASWASFVGTGAVSIGTSSRNRSSMLVLKNAGDTVTRSGDWFALGY